MATLTGELISATYKDLLQISNANAGIDATLRTVSDGEATASVLQLSSAAMALLSGTFTIADGATIGQAAGPLLTFDDTLDFLEITGCKVGIGTATPGGNLEVAQTITATGILKGIVFTGAVNTNQTLSTEIPSLTITAAGREWATGALALQREVLITQPTYSFVGASTITDAATLGIAGGPVEGANATITNAHGLLIQAGAVGTAAASYGLTVNAQTGATANYAAAFLGGNVGIGTTGPDRFLHAEVSDAVTNAVTYAQRLSHITSGAAVAGFGTGIEFELEENDASNRVAAFITADWEDAGETASADGRLNFGVMTADAAAVTAMSIWNGNVGVGTTLAQGRLDARDGTLVLTDTDVAHGMSVVFPSSPNIYARFGPAHATAGGLAIFGVSDTDNGAVEVYGVIGTANPTDTIPAISLLGAKKDGVGTNWQALGDLETVFQINNLGTPLFTVLGAGHFGIGLVNPLAKLHIDQASTTAAIPVLSLDQADISDGFINFIGATAASAAGPISTWTVANLVGYVRCEINGAQQWLGFYDAPTA